jgi:hypothetical protein
MIEFEVDCFAELHCGFDEAPKNKWLPLTLSAGPTDD